MSRETLDMVDLKERIAISDAFSHAERAMLLAAVNTLSGYDKVELDMSMPPNSGGKIDAVFAWLSVDDGGEGLIASAVSPDLPMCPLVCYRRKTADLMRPYALLAGRVSNKVVRLARFVKREDVEVIRP